MISSPFTHWTSSEIAQLTHGTTSGEWSAHRIHFDSRSIQPGDVFIALRAVDFPTLGTGTTDGHIYLDDALKNGAAGVIVQDIPDHLKNDSRVIKVASTAHAFNALAIAARAHTGARIFGITGSVGKTSTREIMALALTQTGTVYESYKNYNNAMGVPFTLTNMPDGIDYAIIEMGMSHRHEITPLTQMVRPHVAMITTIAPAHIENFDDGLDGIADAKCEIFAGLEPDGIAILPRDTPLYDRLYQQTRYTYGVKNILSFGEDAQADARLISCVEGRNGTRITAIVMGEPIDYFIPAGRHQALNALAVLLAIKASNLDIQQAAENLKNFKPITGRGQEEHLDIGDPENPVILIDESYNASPAAMNAAFRVVALIDPGRGGRRIAILGDMLELGTQGPKLHADLALPLRAANIDLVYTCGPLMRHLHDTLPPEQRGLHRNHATELAQIVPDVLVPGDVVMVKGSHSSRMDLVVEALRALPAKRAKNNQTSTEQNRHAL